MYELFFNLVSLYKLGFIKHVCDKKLICGNIQKFIKDILDINFISDDGRSSCLFYIFIMFKNLGVNIWSLDRIMFKVDKTNKTYLKKSLCI